MKMALIFFMLYAFCSPNICCKESFFLRYSMELSDSDFSDEESSYIPAQKTSLAATKKVTTGKKHLTDLKKILGLDAYQAKLEKKRRKRQAAKARKKGLVLTSSSSDIIQTKASISLGIASAPEIVHFIDHKKRKQKEEGFIEENVVNNNDVSQKKSKELTLKDARFEVFKFGVSGMDKKSKEEANKALAVRLGAKPEKNTCIEYKQLKEDRLAEKEALRIQEEERKQSLQGVRKKSGNSNPSKKSTKVKKKGNKSDFKLGTFDGGMLKLSSKDLKSVKSKR